MDRLDPLPEVLTGIVDAPFSLYYCGDSSLLQKRMFAVVGTRRPSQYTKIWTAKIASELSRHGVVVSGGAMGVDAVAHQAAGPNTIAVMASSLDIIYPKVNKKLIEGIYREGLALSEYEKGYKPFPYTFVKRNRIVVGLSEAVIITEADEESGSMRSAEWALKLNRPLYVLSHRCGESLGTAKLLETGAARPLYSIEQLKKELELESSPLPSSDPLLDFIETNPEYEAVVNRFGETLFEYELEGKVVVQNGLVKAR